MALHFLQEQVNEALSSAPVIEQAPSPRTTGPSSLYQGKLWKAALQVTRALPFPVANGLAQFGCHAYRIAQPSRKQIVLENLLPVFDGDEEKANAAANQLFSRFGTKLVDLFRFEAGNFTDDRFVELSAWENFEKPFRRGKGVLMVTPHLGNWEIGATLMMRGKVKFFAVTQPEPGADFTETRAAARARWGIETIVVGQDAFASLEIIRRLQEGAAVALLIDRPFGPSGVTVELFGRPYQASIAAAEMARASGCAVVAGMIVEESGGYAARFKPEFEYDRRALGNREGRREFTQRIMTAFEPDIRRYADQWYQFIPVWPKS